MRNRVSSDDLLILLEVARSGRFTRAGELLGLSHTTVARRIAAIERALGSKVLIRTAGGMDLTPLGRRALAAAEEVEGLLSTLEAEPLDRAILEDVVRLSAPDAFTVRVAAPVAAKLRRAHPGVSVELISATRRAAIQRSGLDIEIVVGEPRVLRAEAIKIGSYELGLYGSTQYFERFRRPTALEDLEDHGLVYFITSMLQIDDLDVGRRFVPNMTDAVTSTNVFAHIEATRGGAGLGLLPTFLADDHSDLERVLETLITVPLDYWLVTRAEALRRPAVAAVVTALRQDWISSAAHG
ncbi:LysR family transcriptional regulator [Rhodococcus sp. APC 3903]|uniref:LysR family transcriptional regulator n=1 Tax=Rhodococcus sp. APC 3903 TaxID=3035193 RepID=UPI0025B50D0D|nr:LysR family transcriptional regulator [Rhodococcus sp. APC 3903]MDN3459891.1 LysR family transcriptional regulator [Rhodococcus sp. APC 3903]